MGGIIISILKETKHFSVLNYNDNCVCINIAPGKTIKIDASAYGEPTTVPLTLDEIKFANNGYSFKTGALEFSEDMEDVLYEELRIDKDKVLKLNEIREILIHPTKDGLLKILSIISLSDFDRVRGQFQALKSEGYKLTLDMADIIERRTKELFKNQIKSNIQIYDPDEPAAGEKQRISDLEKQLEELKLRMSSVLPTGDNVNITNGAEKEITKPMTSKKSPGRPKKTTD